VQILGGNIFWVPHVRVSLLQQSVTDPVPHILPHAPQLLASVEIFFFKILNFS